MQALHDTLKKIEFIELGEFDHKKGPVCPMCGNARAEGHRSYCILREALEAFKRKGGFTNG